MRRVVSCGLRTGGELIHHVRDEHNFILDVRRTVLVGVCGECAGRRGKIRMALIRLNNATVSYEGDLAAENVSFSVEKGDYLVILGENGSGKSTVMKAMLGLVKLKSGEVIHSDGLKKNGRGLSAPADPDSAGFPGFGGRVVQSGVVNRLGLAAVPGAEGETAGSPADGAAGNLGDAQKALSRPFRRPAAAGASGPGPVRDGQSAFAGRAGDGPGPGDHGGNVPKSFAISTGRAWPS